jgi:AraC family transcriptional regulator
MSSVETCTPETEYSHRLAVERAIRTMHEDLGQRLTLDDLGRVAYISPYHFNRIFHHVVGIPPGHFLTALRIYEGKRLLITTNRRVIDICFDVGFISPGTFSRRFRDFVGLSPNHLRSLTDRLAEIDCASLVPRCPTRSSKPGPGLCGTVTAPRDFDGPIFVGLFSSPLPQSRPFGCSFLERPGSYQLPHVPDGRYYLLSVALPWAHAPQDLLLYDSALRGGSTTVPIRVRKGKVQGPLDVTLRPSQVTDPPILLTLPWLMAQVPALAAPLELVHLRPWMEAMGSGQRKHQERTA